MRKLRLGMPTLLEMPEIEDSAKLAVALGLDFIELNMNLPEFQSEYIDIKRLQGIKQDYGLYFTLHVDENLNVCDFNPLVAKAYLDTMKSSLEIAEQLEAPIVNMHLAQGVYFNLPEGKAYLFEKYAAHYMQGLGRLRALCESECGDAVICIENAGGYDKPFIRAGLDYLLQSQVFELCFDTGHNHTAGGADERIIRANGGKLRHMHLHDAIGKKNHLPLGTGEVDIINCLRLAEERLCSVVVETKTREALESSVDWIRSRHQCL